jgi:hypothetical protein
MSTDTDWNQAYYGQPFAARQLVMQMQGGNPGAESLRDLLTRNGSRAAISQPAPAAGQAGYAPPYPAYQPPGSGPSQAPQPLGGYPAPPSSAGRPPVQEQSLPR